MDPTTRQHTPLALVQGVIHNPLFWRALAPAQLDAGLAQVRANFERFRSELDQARPDVIVYIGSDHLTEIFLDRMPPIMVGKAAVYRGTTDYEARDYGLPIVRAVGQQDLSRSLLRACMDRDVDLAFADELVLDHSVVQPLLYLRPEWDVPIVPVMTNCMAPPLPTAARFYTYGTVLRAAIDEVATGLRVAVVSSGHLSVDIGGPRHHAGAPDTEFDDQALGWVKTGDVDAAIQGCSFDRLTAAGNVSHQFLNFILAMGIVDGAPATFAEGTTSRFTTSPFFEWRL